MIQNTSYIEIWFTVQNSSPLVMCTPVQSRYQIFVKGYWFLAFSKNMGRGIGENLSKNL